MPAPTILPPRPKLTITFEPRHPASIAPAGLSPLERSRAEATAAIAAARRDSRATLPARPDRRATGRMPAVTLEQLCAEARGSL